MSSRSSPTRSCSSTRRCPRSRHRRRATVASPSRAADAVRSLAIRAISPAPVVPLSAISNGRWSSGGPSPPASSIAGTYLMYSSRSIGASGAPAKAARSATASPPPSSCRDCAVSAGAGSVMAAFSCGDTVSSESTVPGVGKFVCCRSRGDRRYSRACITVTSSSAPKSSASPILPSASRARASLGQSPPANAMGSASSAAYTGPQSSAIAPTKRGSPPRILPWSSLSVCLTTAVPSISLASAAEPVPRPSRSSCSRPVASSQSSPKPWPFWAPSSTRSDSNSRISATAFSPLSCAADGRLYITAKLNPLCGRSRTAPVIPKRNDASFCPPTASGDALSGRTIGSPASAAASTALR
mmetsp:Transcript_27595/g.82633  ORF Transcript_27595/g.82633 Transcript_27595/m.82633 type:complete len:356 (-) Transcript_27595:415-1482(-)